MPRDMKGRVYVYILVILVPALLLVWFSLSDSSLRRMEKGILLREPGQVDHIRLFDQWDTVRLWRVNGSWQLEDGEPASPVAVENLLRAAQALQVDGLFTGDAPQAGYVNTRLVFARGEKEVMSYDLGRSPGGLILRPAGKTALYRVSIPGYGNLDPGRVFSTSANHFREHMLIDLRPSEIRAVEFAGPGKPPYRFTTDSTGTLECFLPGSGRRVDPERLDQLSVRLLFSYFTSIRFEERLEDGEGPGALQEERWLGTLKVQAFTGEQHELKVYSMVGEDGEGTHMYRALVVHNSEPGILVVKYLYLDVLMRDLSRFFKEPQ